MAQKNKLIVQGDYPVIASPTLAQAYGVASAIFLQKLHYFLHSKESQVIQQYKYFYHSYEQWAETLCTYSLSTIKRIVSKLKKSGILDVKKLSQNKWIQTNFYSINYRKLSSLLKGSTESVEIEISEKKPVQSLTPSPKLVKNCAKDLKVSALTQSKIKTKTNKVKRLLSPLAPIVSSVKLDAMSLKKRGLYNQLIQFKIDIHYDDVYLDDCLNRKNSFCKKLLILKISSGT